MFGIRPKLAKLGHFAPRPHRAPGDTFARAHAWPRRAHPVLAWRSKRALNFLIRDGFLPATSSPQFKPMLAPLEVRDPMDPRIGHLIGLWFHRAWCLRGIASVLPHDDARRALFERIARLHVRTGLEQMFDSGYGGAHWLASFALLALSE